MLKTVMDMLKLNFVQGWKTYAWAAVTIIVAASSYFGIGDVAPAVVNKENALQWLWATLAAVFIRKGIEPK